MARRESTCKQCGNRFICRNKGQQCCSKECGNLCRKRTDPIPRFWKKVRMAGPHECWLWTAHMSSGYGRFSPHAPGYVYSHRFSWELANGTVPEGMYVCHKCDVRNCVNPSHLFIGTQQDNMRDMASKGRARGGRIRGEAHKLSKLTTEKVLEIRATKNLTHSAIARKYGVSRSLISSIIKNEVWTHV